MKILKIDKYLRNFFSYVSTLFQDTYLKCYICGSENFYSYLLPNENININVCLKCGPYIRRSYSPIIINNYNNLSSYLRHRFEEVEIDENNITLNIPNIDDDLNSFIKNSQSSAPEFSQKQFYLLQAIENVQEYVGEKIYLSNVPADDIPERVLGFFNKFKSYFDSYNITRDIIDDVYRKNCTWNYNQTDLEKYLFSLFKELVEDLNKKIGVNLAEFIRQYYPTRIEMLTEYLKTLSYSTCDEEFEYCLQNLSKEEYIEYDNQIKSIQIASKGYEYLEKQKNIDTTRSKTAFIGF